MVGDFNARTKFLKDTLNKDKHEENILDDFYSEIYTIRNNQDEILNDYGKQLIEYCISTRSYIANGRTLGDIQGKLTCHKSNGSSYGCLNVSKFQPIHFQSQIVFGFTFNQ